MGVDNRAERAIPKIEFRKDLAKPYHEAFRRQQPIAAPWTMLSLANKAATIASIVALIDEINRRLDHPKRACGLTNGWRDQAARHCSTRAEATSLLEST